MNTREQVELDTIITELRGEIAGLKTRVAQLESVQEKVDEDGYQEMGANWLGKHPSDCTCERCPKRTMILGSTRIYDEQEREIMVYKGMLTDGRVICVDQDVFEVGEADNDPASHNNPDEWLESLDGECVFIEGHFMEAK